MLHRKNMLNTQAKKSYLPSKTKCKNAVLQEDRKLF